MEGSQGLAGAGKRGDEGMAALGDGRPSLCLDICRRIESTCKPGPNKRMEL